MGRRFPWLLHRLQGLLVGRVAEIVFDLSFELMVGSAQGLCIVCQRFSVVLLLVERIALVKMDLCGIRQRLPGELYCCPAAVYCPA